jgi:DNA-binding Lrp family transcriptional regulator
MQAAEKLGLSRDPAYNLIKMLEDAQIGLAKKVDVHKEPGKKGKGQDIYEIDDNVAAQVTALLTKLGS